MGMNGVNCGLSKMEWSWYGKNWEWWIF